MAQVPGIDGLEQARARLEALAGGRAQQLKAAVEARSRSSRGVGA